MRRFRTFLTAGVVASAIAAMPISGFAALLTTYNNSDSSSTVMITSGPNAGKCATSIQCPFGIPCGSIAWTAAKTKSVVPWKAVVYMCTGSFLGSMKSPCTATVYAGDDAACQGKAIGTASMTSSGVISVNTTDSNYKLTGGNYQMTIDQK